MVKKKDLANFIAMASLGGVIPDLKVVREGGKSIAGHGTTDATCLHYVEYNIDLGEDELLIPVDWLISRLKYAEDEVTLRCPKGVLTLESANFRAPFGKFTSDVEWRLDLIKEMMGSVPKNFITVDAKMFSGLSGAKAEVGIEQYRIQWNPKDKKHVFILLGDLTDDKVKPMLFRREPTKVRLKKAMDVRYAASFEEVFSVLKGPVRMGFDFENDNRLFVLSKGKQHKTFTVIGSKKTED